MGPFALGVAKATPRQLLETCPEDSLESTGQLQRLLGQLDIYHSQWKGPKEVIVLICGDTQRDLFKTLTFKVESLKKEEFRASPLFGKQRIFLIARDKTALPEKPKSIWSF